MSDYNFKDKIVLITGASRGIGAGLALAFAEKKARIVINFLSSKKEAQILSKKIKNLGTDFLLVKADISHRKEVEKVLDSVLKKFGRIDILINNAGIVTGSSDWRKISEKDWRRTLDVNLKGVFECCRAFGRIMLKQKYGKIVNISSLRGIFGGSEVIAYAASKAGVENLTKSFAKALAPFINVNCLTLGRINLGMGCALKNRGDKNVRKIENVVNKIFFLVSDKSKHITGQTLFLDGRKSL